MQLVGRQSSHYTRLVRIVAAELGVATNGCRRSAPACRRAA